MHSSGMGNLTSEVIGKGEVIALGEGLKPSVNYLVLHFQGNTLIDKAMSSDSLYYWQDDAAAIFAQNIDVLNTLG